MQMCFLSASESKSFFSFQGFLLLNYLHISLGEQLVNWARLETFFVQKLMETPSYCTVYTNNLNKNKAEGERCSHL